METRFIDGGEFVDKATYIETRDKLSRAIERIAELEAQLRVAKMSKAEVVAALNGEQEVSDE